jgi:hypothetical protein
MAKKATKKTKEAPRARKSTKSAPKPKRVLGGSLEERQAEAMRQAGAAGVEQNLPMSEIQRRIVAARDAVK